RLLREPSRHADDVHLRPEHDRRRRPRRVRRGDQRRDLPDHRRLRRHLHDRKQGDGAMTTAAEAAPGVVRPLSRSRRLRKSRFGRVLFKVPFYLLIAVIFVYCLFPFYWAVRSSFTPEGDLFSTPIQYFPANPTLDNYRGALNASFFTDALRNSAIVAASVTLLSLAIGATAAYALGRFRFHGRSFVMYLMLSMT